MVGAFRIQRLQTCKPSLKWVAKEEGTGKHDNWYSQNTSPRTMVRVLLVPLSFEEKIRKHY